MLQCVDIFRAETTAAAAVYLRSLFLAAAAAFSLHQSGKSHFHQTSSERERDGGEKKISTFSRHLCCSMHAFFMTQHARIAFRRQN